MSRSGSVAGVTTIISHGSSSDLWDLVILGDGFLAQDLADYRSIADRFMERLLSTSPFDEFQSVINVHRVDVVSDERGAGDLIHQIHRANYFDSAFGANGLARLLVTDQTLALETAVDAVPQMNAALVVVNSEEYGGSGGAVPVFSRAENASEIAIHELGHSQFHLADEYEDYTDSSEAEPSKYGGPEPLEINVTATLDPLKWGSLATPGYPIPTRQNDDCREEVDEQLSVPSGVVGAFEGAMYHRCGIFRPSDRCRMRVLGMEFCAVCREGIRSVLTPFQTHSQGKRRAVRSRR